AAAASAPPKSVVCLPSPLNETSRSPGAATASAVGASPSNATVTAASMPRRKIIGFLSRRCGSDWPGDRGSWRRPASIRLQYRRGHRLTRGHRRAPLSPQERAALALERRERGGIGGRGRRLE